MGLDEFIAEMRGFLFSAILVSEIMEVVGFFVKPQENPPINPPITIAYEQKKDENLSKEYREINPEKFFKEYENVVRRMNNFYKN